MKKFKRGRYIPSYYWLLVPYLHCRSTEYKCSYLGKGKFVDLNKYSLIEFLIPMDHYPRLAFESYGYFSKKDVQRIIERGFSLLNLPEPYVSFRFDIK